MQKSGSAYIYNIINELLIRSGNKSAREIKEKYKLENLMQWHNNNIGELSFIKIIKLLIISIKENKFVVKTHDTPSDFHNILLKMGLIKTIYIYRDPRDVLLSAQDHGRKILKNGESHTFAKMINFDDAFKSVKSWTNIYKSYKKVNGILTVSYEELLSDPLTVLNNICDYLKITVSENEIQNILKKYDRKNPNADMRGMHFNTGVIKRYF